jgi:hypothetical protein
VRKLFLDDIRNPINAFSFNKNPIYKSSSWDIVRDYDEFVSYILQQGLPDLVSFDHDLADEHVRDCVQQHLGMKEGKIIRVDLKYDSYKEKTGLSCAKWLVEYCMDNKLRLPEYLSHSANPVGKLNILSYLDNYRKVEGTT